MTQASLATITAYARAGAIDHAWRLFAASGLDAVSDDAAVLALRGRLLKDRALREIGEARRDGARAAAAAYAEAARLRPAPYPLINAATLQLIGGDVAEARRLARTAMSLLADSSLDETAYYIAATEAEALLIYGDIEGARIGLARAVACAPRAWEDHASTLRQFATILAATGENDGWLDAFRPPRSLHYAGPLALAEDDQSALAERIDRMLAEENIGYGYGALAAGADLLVAERLLMRGADLHVVLPGGLSAFVSQSVDPFGPAVRERFEAALACAASVSEVGDPAVSAFSQDIELADLVAMGRAAMNARALQSAAVQLVIGEPAGQGARARAARRWTGAGRRQLVIPSLHISSAAPPTTVGRGPAALLGIALTSSPGTELAPFDPGLADRLAPLGNLERDPDLIAPLRWTGDGALAGFATPEAAWDAAMRLRSAMALSGPLRLSLHMGVTALVDAGGGGPVLLSAAWGEAARILDVTPDSAVYGSEALAAALSTGPRTIDAGFVGELAGPAQLSLYSLAARA